MSKQAVSVVRDIYEDRLKAVKNLDNHIRNYGTDVLLEVAKYLTNGSTKVGVGPSRSGKVITLGPVRAAPKRVVKKTAKVMQKGVTQAVLKVLTDAAGVPTPSHYVVSALPGYAKNSVQVTLSNLANSKRIFKLRGMDGGMLYYIPRSPSDEQTVKE